MSDVRRVPVFVLVGWTLLLWASRLRNVLGNDELSNTGTAWRVGVVVLFVVLALVVADAWRRSHDRRRRITAVRVLGGWTIGFWIVRGGGIILDDHDLAFTLVHSVLMAVSIAVAAWAWPRRAMVPAAA